MSRIRFPPFAQAPNKTPSVPTFWPHRSCRTTNCLKENESLPIQKLFVVVNDVVHKVHHGLGYLKHLGSFVQPTLSFKEIISHTVPTTIVFHAKILDVLIIFGKSRRACF